MLSTRHEEYNNYQGELPFVLHVDISRDTVNFSDQKNWHEELELQLCTKGSGNVLLNGESYPFHQGDVAVVNSNVIHHTGTASHLTYSCIIIRRDFCEAIGIDCRSLRFAPIIREPSVSSLFSALLEVCSHNEDRFYIAKAHSAVIDLLVAIAQDYSVPEDGGVLGEGAFENVRSAISYIRKNYSKKLTLEDLSRHVYSNKYSLCRDFKRLTGQTVIEYTNRYRCQKAAELLSEGNSVTEALSLCGFDNPSFFSKLFKRYIGVLPSKYRP